MGDIFDQVANGTAASTKKKGAGVGIDIFDQVADDQQIAPMPTPEPGGAGRAGESRMSMLKRAVVQPFKDDADTSTQSGYFGRIKHAVASALPTNNPGFKAVGNLVTEGADKVKDLIDYRTDQFEGDNGAIAKLQRNVAAPMGKAGADFAGSMAQPESIATMGVFGAVPTATAAGKLVHSAAGAYFAVPALKNAVHKGVEAVDRFIHGDTPGGVESATGAVFDTALGAETGAPGVRTIANAGKSVAHRAAYPMEERMRKTPTGTGEINPVEAFTPEEIKAHAEDASQGPVVNMTPAEITESGGLRGIQGVGQKSLFGKSNLQDHQANAQSAIIGRSKKLMKKVAPTSPNTLQTARELQTETAVAAEKAKTVANTDYANWRKDVSPGSILIDLTDVNKKYANKLEANKDIFANIPAEQAGKLRAGMDKAKDFGIKSEAVDEFGDPTGESITDPVMDVDAVRETRSHWLDSLRELKRKGRADSREAGLYADIVHDLDQSIEKGVHDHVYNNTMGTEIEKTAAADNAVGGWRKANASWKKYTNDFYGDDSVLANILDTSQTDLQHLPGKILDRSTGGNTVHIDQMREHGINIGGLQREVMDRALNTGFRTPQNKLAGFEDNYLQGLFADNPQDLAALYKNARIGRSVGVDFNPSNTAGAISARGEFEAPIKMVKDTAEGNGRGVLDEIVGAVPGYAASHLSTSKWFKNWMTRVPKSKLTRATSSTNPPQTPPAPPTPPTGSGGGSPVTPVAPTVPPAGAVDISGMLKGDAKKAYQAGQASGKLAKTSDELLRMTDDERSAVEIASNKWDKAEVAKGRTRADIDKQMDYGNFPVEDVPVNKLKLTEEKLWPETVSHYKEAYEQGHDAGAEVHAVEHNGNYYIYDGNHRAAGAKAAGLSIVRMKVQHLPTDASSKLRRSTDITSATSKNTLQAVPDAHQTMRRGTDAPKQSALDNAIGTSDATESAFRKEWLENAARQAGISVNDLMSPHGKYGFELTVADANGKDLPDMNVDRQSWMDHVNENIKNINGSAQVTPLTGGQGRGKLVREGEYADEGNTEFGVGANKLKKSGKTTTVYHGTPKEGADAIFKDRGMRGTDTGFKPGDPEFDALKEQGETSAAGKVGPFVTRDKNIAKKYAEDYSEQGRKEAEVLGIEVPDEWIEGKDPNNDAAVGINLKRPISKNRIVSRESVGSESGSKKLRKGASREQELVKALDAYDRAVSKDDTDTANDHAETIHDLAADLGLNSYIESGDYEGLREAMKPKGAKGSKQLKKKSVVEQTEKPKGEIPGALTSERQAQPHDIYAGEGKPKAKSDLVADKAMREAGFEPRNFDIENIRALTEQGEDEHTATAEYLWDHMMGEPNFIDPKDIADHLRSGGELDDTSFATLVKKKVTRNPKPTAEEIEAHQNPKLTMPKSIDDKIKAKAGDDYEIAGNGSTFDKDGKPRYYMIVNSSKAKWAEVDVTPEEQQQYGDIKYGEKADRVSAYLEAKDALGDVVDTWFDEPKKGSKKLKKGPKGKGPEGKARPGTGPGAMLNRESNLDVDEGPMSKDPDAYYHGTSESRAKAILHEGLKPSREFADYNYSDDPERVFMSKDKEFAGNYTKPNGTEEFPLDDKEGSALIRLKMKPGEVTDHPDPDFNYESWSDKHVPADRIKSVDWKDAKGNKTGRTRLQGRLEKITDPSRMLPAEGGTFEHENSKNNEDVRNRFDLGKSTLPFDDDLNIYAEKKVEAHSKKQERNLNRGRFPETGIPKFKKALITDPSSLHLHEPGSMDLDDVIDYTGRLNSGEEPPPIQVARTDRGKYIIDGQHRASAAQRSGKPIEAIIVDLRSKPKASKKLKKTDTVGTDFDKVQLERTKQFSDTASEIMGPEKWARYRELRDKRLSEWHKSQGREEKVGPVPPEEDAEFKKFSGLKPEEEKEWDNLRGDVQYSFFVAHSKDFPDKKVLTREEYNNMAYKKPSGSKLKKGPSGKPN